MQINNEHQKYKYPNALKSVNFKGQTIPIKQITDKGLKIASGAIGAIGLAGVVMNNSLNSPNEIEDKLQGLTKQQIDLCTNSDGEISIEAIELLKKLQKSVVNSENSDGIINRLMLSCKNYKGSWRDKEYTTICEEAISLANKMLDLEYEPNLIHCTLSNANGSGTHDSMQLTALTKYIECYPQIDKRKIGDLALGLNKEKIDFLNKVLELKINNKISLSESELELLMRFGSEIQGSSNFIIKSLETGKMPSKIIENLAYCQNLHNNDSNTKVVLKSLITSEKLFDDPTALLIVRSYLDKPYMRESREQILSMIKSMIEDNSFSPKQLKDTVNIGKYGIGLQYTENREYLTGCGKSEIDVFAENTKELISELYNEDSIPKELLNPNKIYSKLKTESKETIIHKIKNFANQHSETIEKIEATKQKMLEHPQLYINGEISTLEAQKNKILDWFYQYYEAIIPLFDALDKESIDYLMRLRLDNAEEYLDTVSDYFKKEDIELLKNLIQSHDINGEPLKPKQKVEMIDLIEAYNDNELSTDIISNMVSKLLIKIQTVS